MEIDRKLKGISKVCGRHLKLMWVQRERNVKRRLKWQFPFKSLAFPFTSLFKLHANSFQIPFYFLSFQIPFQTPHKSYCRFHTNIFQIPFKLTSRICSKSFQIPFKFPSSPINFIQCSCWISVQIPYQFPSNLLRIPSVSGQFAFTFRAISFKSSSKYYQIPFILCEKTLKGIWKEDERKFKRIWMEIDMKLQGIFKECERILKLMWLQSESRLKWQFPFKFLAFSFRIPPKLN